MMADKIFIKLKDTSGSWWIQDQGISVTRNAVVEVKKTAYVTTCIKAGRAIECPEKEYDAYLDLQIASQAENKENAQKSKDDRVKVNIEREQKALDKRNEALAEKKAIEQAKADEKAEQAEADKDSLTDLEDIDTEDGIHAFIDAQTSEDVIDAARQKLAHIQAAEIEGTGVGDEEFEQGDDGDLEAGDVVDHIVTEEDVKNNPGEGLKVGEKVEVPFQAVKSEAAPEEVKSEEKAVNATPVKEDEELDRAGNKVEKKAVSAKQSGNPGKTPAKKQGGKTSSTKKENNK